MATSRQTIHIPRPPEQVWHTMTDWEHTAWRRDLSGVTVLSSRCFVEYTKGGRATTFTVTAWNPPLFWAFRMENGNMSGHWEGTLEEEAGGTRLTCTETVAAKHRWMAPFVPWYLKRQQKIYLDDLQRELGKQE